MKLEDLESLGLIERIDTNIGKVNRALGRVGKDLITARAIIKMDEEWAYTISYHAMLRAGRALMLSIGYRPKGKDQHKTVVEFCSNVLGEDYRLLMNKFHRMRQKRHKFVYEFDSPISKTEADQSIKDAKKLVDAIYEKINGKEKGLFKE